MEYNFLFLFFDQKPNFVYLLHGPISVQFIGLLRRLQQHKSLKGKLQEYSSKQTQNRPICPLVNLLTHQSFCLKIEKCCCKEETKLHDIANVRNYLKILNYPMVNLVHKRRHKV